MYRGRWILALLYADDMAMFAEEEEGLISEGVGSTRRRVVSESKCRKCGIMHFRRKRMKRSEDLEEFIEWGES